jgi:hypothetical protein
MAVDGQYNGYEIRRAEKGNAEQVHCGDSSLAREYGAEAIRRLVSLMRQRFSSQRLKSFWIADMALLRKWWRLAIFDSSLFLNKLELKRS